MFDQVLYKLIRAGIKVHPLSPSFCHVCSMRVLGHVKAAAAGTLNKIGVEDLDVAGKRVLMRVDFNVPMDGKTITNTQVSCSVPSVACLLTSDTSHYYLRPENRCSYPNNQVLLDQGFLVE